MHSDDESKPPEAEFERGAEVRDDIVREHADGREAEDEPHREERQAARQEDRETEAPLDASDQRVGSDDREEERGCEAEHDAKKAGLRRERRQRRGERCER